MKRKEVLDKAAECVLKDRQNQYGGMEDNFFLIAKLWSIFLRCPISAWQVSVMMIMLKIARACGNPQYSDNWVDIAGYAACGAECVENDWGKYEAEVSESEV